MNNQPRKKKKKKSTQEKEKEKKWRAANPGKRKKKVKSGQKLRLVLFASPSCVFNYKNAIELWVMETENCQKLFSVSITHNSKIRELSDRNRVIICQTTFLLWFLPFLSYELWVMETENWVIKKGNPNDPNLFMPTMQKEKHWKQMAFK